MPSPFKDVGLLRQEITKFINSHKGTVASHAKRISDYFEMSCFNDIVRYYELRGYSASILNLQGGNYKYKCSAYGYHLNFSYFRLEINFGDETHSFDLFHNLAVESSHVAGIFMTPDIVIINANAVQVSTDYYETKIRFSHVKNEDVLTFFECKHFTPFPELLFNFIGIVNELCFPIMNNSLGNRLPKHLAPSLMISGKGNRQAERIRESLEKRYCINIIFDIFHAKKSTFTVRNHKSFRTAGSL